MRKLMIGNAAVARGAYEAGVRVVSSYPGTPSTEITEEMAGYDEVYSEWAPNEKVALEVAIGASISGARAMSCMKHVGLNVAADPLYTAAYTGVGGGLVICVADDPGMHSSQNEQDTRRHAMGAKVPVLEPSDSAECLEFTKAAFDMSEEFDTPVILRLSTRISHSQSIVGLGERDGRELLEYKKDIGKYVMMPAMARARHEIVVKRMEALSKLSEKSPLNRVEWGGEIGVITSGAAYQYVKEAMPGASILKLGITWPLPKKLITDFAAKLKKLYIIEELEPIIEEHAKALGLRAVGKELLPLTGEYSAALIRERILGEKAEPKPQEAPISPRPPVMCAGCPHRGVHYVLNKLKLTVMGDIGCYTLGALSPTESIDACVCMGAGVGMAHGFQKARGVLANKTVAIIGDSTFIHSGITGLIDIVYNRGNSTVIILDNSITGMTGHQQNPTTGLTIKNEPTASVDLELLAKAVGIKRVSVVDPFDLAALEKMLKAEIAADEPSVIIARRPCALLKSVKYEGKAVINDKCTLCKACLRLGCPAINFKGGKMIINPTQCNGCGLCLNVCRFGAIDIIK